MTTTPAAQLKQAADKPEGYGHEPVWINPGYCGGCDQCGDLEEREVCLRCRTVRHESGWVDVYEIGIDGLEVGEPRRVYERWPVYASVEWPCATAVVLGLTDGEVAR